MTAKLVGRFVVKEGEPGRFVLSFETSSGQSVGFELQAHATIETAGQLAREMNRAVVGMQVDGLGVFTWNEVEQPSTEP